jgi:hypothetical protein
MLFEYLLADEPHPIWLENLVAFNKMNDIEGMVGFLSSVHGNAKLFLQLYEGACRYSFDHSAFYRIASDNYRVALSPVLSVLEYLVSSDIHKHDDTLVFHVLKYGSESLDAEVEKRAVMLAVAMANKEFIGLYEFINNILNDRPKFPNAVDYRRLCFVYQLSIETGLFEEEIGQFKDLLAPRSKYLSIEYARDNITLKDIIDEIPLFAGRHNCIHECYQD